MFNKFTPIVQNTKTGGTQVTREVPIANSATIRIGSFFDGFTGTNGAQAFVANQRTRGIVLDIMIYVGNSYISVDEYMTKYGTGAKGVILANSATQNLGYTASAANVTAVNPDYIIYEEINIGDRVEAFLGAAGVPVARGTTPASAVLNNFIEPDPAFPWMLLESGANAVATGFNFQIIERPLNRNKVIVKLINADGAIS